MMNAKDLQTNLEQDYYNGEFVAHTITKEILSAANAAGHSFEWIEVTFPDGKNYLCIKTPANVLNGPGKKYIVTSQR